MNGSHFIVPELGPDVKFSYASHKAVQEYKEAKAVSFFGHRTLASPMLFSLNYYVFLYFWLYLSFGITGQLLRVLLLTRNGDF